MAVKIESYGQLAEITGKAFSLDVNDTNHLTRILTDKYPAFANMKYMVAVNRKVVSTNTQLNPTDSVALLPPYSGG